MLGEVRRLRPAQATRHGQVCARHLVCSLPKDDVQARARSECNHNPSIPEAEAGGGGIQPIGTSSVE